MTDGRRPATYKESGTAGCTPTAAGGATPKGAGKLLSTLEGIVAISTPLPAELPGNEAATRPGRDCSETARRQAPSDETAKGLSRDYYETNAVVTVAVLSSNGGDRRDGPEGPSDGEAKKGHQGMKDIPMVGSAGDGLPELGRPAAPRRSALRWITTGMIAGAADRLGRPTRAQASPPSAPAPVPLEGDPTGTDDIAVGSPGVNYVDPEFHSSTNRLTFRDRWGADGNTWVSVLDPISGRFVSDTGQDILVDSQMAGRKDECDNGPEWIRDDGVDKVLYTRKDGSQECMYIRDPAGGPPELVGPADKAVRNHFAGTTASTDRAKILYRKWIWLLQTWRVFWLDLKNPTKEFALPEVALKVSLPTWFDSRYILISQKVDDVFQLASYDTITRSVSVQTADQEDKFGAYAWRAPELDGKLLYMAAIRFAGDEDVTALRIYWRQRSGDLTLTPFATLTFPTGTAPGVVHSPEPFVFQNRSYISLGLKPANTVDTSLWVFCVPQTKDGPPPRPPQRVDDPTLKVNKIDPETYVTDSRVFVYYYYIEPGSLRTRLRRCAVNLPG
jgi:hypothetical protein